MPHNNIDGQAVEKYYRLLKKSQRKFGLARFELGVILETVKTKELWRGKAESFKAYLEQERLNGRACNQYMRVARKLFFELQLTDEDFDRLADVGMGTLDTACRVITPGNKEEVINMLTILSERDAQFELEVIEAEKVAHCETTDKISPYDRRLQKVFSEYFALPDDLRMDFKDRMRLATSQTP